MKKSSAADRTVSLFQEAIQKATEPTKEEIATAPEDAPEAIKAPAETIEQQAQRWRDTAFYGQETVSKHFGVELMDKAGKETFRLTEKDGWMFLEKYANSKDGMAYHWSGVMFRSESLYELTGLFVKASRERKAKEDAQVSGSAGRC